MKIELSEKFSAFLKQVHMGGLINEAVINFKKDGSASCQAVDLTNTVFVDSVIDNSGAKEEYSIGLGNLATICKYIDGPGVSVQIENEWAIFKKKGKGSIKTLSLQPSLVPTSPQEPIDSDEFLNQENALSIKINKEEVENFLEHFSLIGGPSVVVSTENKRVSISSNEQSPQQFNVKFGVASSADKVSVEVYSDFFVAVLKQINWNEELFIFIKNDYPFIISQPDVVWAVTPINS